MEVEGGEGGNVSRVGVVGMSPGISNHEQEHCVEGILILKFTKTNVSNHERNIFKFKCTPVRSGKDVSNGFLEDEHGYWTNRGDIECHEAH